MINLGIFNKGYLMQIPFYYPNFALILRVKINFVGYPKGKS